MLASLIAFLESRSPALITALAFTLLAAVASLDYHLDDQLSFSILYLIPIAVVSLYSARASFLFCLVCAGVANSIHHFSGHPYSSGLTTIWNTLASLAVFLLTAYLLDRLKTHLAMIDNLMRKDDETGVLNMRGLQDEVNGRLMLADRYSRPVAVARIDVDGFKAVVDTRGRTAGVQILKEVAGTIGQCVRVTDIVGRVGGDEFVVFLPETDYPGAQSMFKRIHEALDRLAVERDSPISFNISVAAYKTAPATLDDALQYVDRIMYRLRQTGKMDILYEEQVGPNRAAYHER